MVNRGARRVRREIPYFGGLGELGGQPHLPDPPDLPDLPISSQKARPSRT